MNKERRQKIREAIAGISNISSALENVKDDEDASRENIPENLQEGEQYEISENCSEVLEDAICELNEISKSLEEIT